MNCPTPKTTAPAIVQNLPKRLCDKFGGEECSDLVFEPEVNLYVVT